MLHAEALAQLQLYGGYPVETANNLFLAAFPNSLEAVVWSLQVVQTALSLLWWVHTCPQGCWLLPSLLLWWIPVLLLSMLLPLALSPLLARPNCTTLCCCRLLVAMLCLAAWQAAQP